VICTALTKSAISGVRSVDPALNGRLPKIRGSIERIQKLDLLWRLCTLSRSEILDTLVRYLKVCRRSILGH
jgi:hypothetical protein